MSYSSSNYTFVQSFKEIKIIMRQETLEIRPVARAKPPSGKPTNPYRIISK